MVLCTIHIHMSLGIHITGQSTVSASVFDLARRQQTAALCCVALLDKCVTPSATISSPPVRVSLPLTRYSQFHFAQYSQVRSCRLSLLKAQCPSIPLQPASVLLSRVKLDQKSQPLCRRKQVSRKDFVMPMY